MEEKSSVRDWPRGTAGEKKQGEQGKKGEQRNFIVSRNPERRNRREMNEGGGKEKEKKKGRKNSHEVTRDLEDGARDSREERVERVAEEFDRRDRERAQLDNEEGVDPVARARSERLDQDVGVGVLSRVEAHQRSEHFGRVFVDRAMQT